VFQHFAPVAVDKEKKKCAPARPPALLALVGHAGLGTEPAGPAKLSRLASRHLGFSFGILAGVAGAAGRAAARAGTSARRASWGKGRKPSQRLRHRT